MSSISEDTKSSWMDVTNESVHTSDDIDIGDIEAINRDFVVVKRGYVHVHYYYIPMNKVEGWDGHVVWLKITENEVKRNYQRDRDPDPSNYYIQGHSYADAKPFTTSYFPEMPIIEAKGRTMPSITSIGKKTKAQALGAAAGQPTTTMHICALCDAAFKSEEELSDHVSAKY